MNVPTRLVTFAAVLGLAFGGAALAGAAIDPTNEQNVAADTGHGGGEPAAAGGEGHGGGLGATESQTAGAEKAAAGGEHADMGATLSGLAVSQDGFTLEPDRTYFEGDGPKRFTFRIVDDRGRVVRDEYELESERELHLVVVRRDTAVYEHVHPRMGEDGTWSVDLALREPGVYRAYADFQIAGEKRALATDLFVPGNFKPTPLPEPEAVNEVDGYSVRLASSQPLRVRQARTLAFSISRGESPVDDLQPYLGARGHLVALREGDLGYLHVHPQEGVGGNAVEFEATFPTAGRYRLFFQFKAGGRVRTVAYTVEVPR
jgi:hypothetical protein